MKQKLNITKNKTYKISQKIVPHNVFINIYLIIFYDVFPAGHRCSSLLPTAMVLLAGHRLYLVVVAAVHENTNYITQNTADTSNLIPSDCVR